MSQSLFTIITKELFTYNSFVHALSGCIGGATAITIFYPLNTVRLKLQVDPSYKEQATFKVLATIYQNEGLSSLYQGLTAQVIALACSNFVYFYTYEMFKSMYRIAYSKKNISSIPNLLIAAVAGVINVLVTTPLWVAMSRLATQRKKKLKDCGGTVQEENDELSGKYIYIYIYIHIITTTCRYIPDIIYISFFILSTPLTSFSQYNLL